MYQILSHGCVLMMVLVTLCRGGVLSAPTSSWAYSDTNNLENRQKRSDCGEQTGRWKFNCECSDTKCTVESVRQAFSTVCSTNQMCYLSNKVSSYWSSSFQRGDTFLSAHCYPDTAYCGDGMMDYTCTCLGGYDSDLKVIVPATIVPVVGIGHIVTAGFLACKCYKRRNQKKASLSEGSSVNQTAESMPSNIVDDSMPSISVIDGMPNTSINDSIPNNSVNESMPSKC